MMNSVRSVGELLREWRQRRRMSQLDLACEAEISPRHMSFLETGRSQPSRDMLLHLAERLEVPLRERNVLLHAAGYAPVFPERPLNDPALHLVRKAIDQLLTAHEPRPALAIDRHWTMVAANRMISHLLTGLIPHCWSRRSTCCVSACILLAWRRALPTWHSGAHICSRDYAARSRRLPIRCCTT
jgi:transcriptional regulator with XRE-family HTH domain